MFEESRISWLRWRVHSRCVEQNVRLEADLRSLIKLGPMRRVVSASTVLYMYMQTVYMYMYVQKSGNHLTLWFSWESLSEALDISLTTEDIIRKVSPLKREAITTLEFVHLLCILFPSKSWCCRHKLYNQTTMSAPSLVKCKPVKLKSQCNSSAQKCSEASFFNFRETHIFIDETTLPRLNKWATEDYFGNVPCPYRTPVWKHLERRRCIHGKIKDDIMWCMFHRSWQGSVCGRYMPYSCFVTSIHKGLKGSGHHW